MPYWCARPASHYKHKNVLRAQVALIYLKESAEHPGKIVGASVAGNGQPCGTIGQP